MCIAACIFSIPLVCQDQENVTDSVSSGGRSDALNPIKVFGCVIGPTYRQWIRADALRENPSLLTMLFHCMRDTLQERVAEINSGEFSTKVWPSLCIFYSLIHRCRSKQKFGGAKDFCQNFSKLARKVVQRLPTSFLPQRSWRPFLVWPPKKVFICFSTNVGRHFCPDFQGFCSDFQGFCPDFRQIKTFGGALAPSPPTALH